MAHYRRVAKGAAKRRDYGHWLESQHQEHLRREEDSKGFPEFYWRLREAGVYPKEIFRRWEEQPCPTEAKEKGPEGPKEQLEVSGISRSQERSKHASL